MSRNFFKAVSKFERIFMKSKKIASDRKLITFDLAMKRLLRSKANFEILEGFLSELLDLSLIQI